MTVKHFYTMRTYLDELLEMETPTIQKKSCGCGCPSCSGKSEMEWDELTDEDELSSSQASSAVAYNREKATSLGWGNHRYDIVEKVFRLNYSPDELTFASLVAEWQASKGLTSDGKLGPSTWEAMKPILGLKPSTPQPSTSYQRVFPLPQLPDGRKPMITSGHHSVNPDPDRGPKQNSNIQSQAQCKPTYLWYKGKCYSKPGSPGHQGADIMYLYKPELGDPPRLELIKKGRMEAKEKTKHWSPEEVWALAFAPGIIHEIGEIDNGWYVKLNHPDGVQSRYFHLTKPIVRKGDQVNAGDRLAQLDRRGSPAHLHFEIRLNWRNHYMDTVDPAPFLQNIPFKHM
jgi:hypothetical protein